jgi:inner membrane protein
MATYLHFAPAIALAVAVGVQRVGWRLTLASAFVAVLPDADFALVTLGLDRYNGPYGHRGFTHSIAFALALGAFGALWAGSGWSRRLGTATFLALCTLSHPVLDGLFDRGICNAWRWPFDDARRCLDWRPVPMGGVPLFGMERFQRELLWIGVPLLLLANAGMLLRWAARHVHRARSFRARVKRPDPRPLAVDAHGAALPPICPRAQRQQRVAAVRTLMARLLAQHRLRQRPTQPTPL